MRHHSHALLTHAFGNFSKTRLSFFRLLTHPQTWRKSGVGRGDGHVGSPACLNKRHALQNSFPLAERKLERASHRLPVHMMKEALTRCITGVLDFSEQTVPSVLYAVQSLWVKLTV
ncbi:hypothetical protein JOB18_006844 [Solea senegalensis]|uniref:Uncharacterized protein n=1 Tax=Solea senegalensis TaxID=28829 RepID=A0AAV6T3N1_SOLSE|nr:hypothetical protein JOB18_006844 [Solea senegalensis]